MLKNIQANYLGFSWNSLNHYALLDFFNKRLMVLAA